MSFGTLYLIPNVLGDCKNSDVLPERVAEVIRSLRHFAVEDMRTCRRFIKSVDNTIDVATLEFHLLDKHSEPSDVEAIANILSSGTDVGVISEAGCPAIADPGADLVAVAQRRGYRVVPLVGPSSILLAMMASGFNGQSFAFSGYLPIDKQQRIKALKKMESRIFAENQSQIFIETPYRNNALLNDLTAHCRGDMRLCIAANITSGNEYIKTKSIAEWKKSLPDINKQPCIFVLYK